MENVNKKLDIALDDWSMMQKTEGDEGADWAERFEQHFYEFIDEFRLWFNQLKNKPSSVEEAEELPEVVQFFDILPGPLQLNFLNELEDIVDGVDQKRFD